jgi:hypothetical protein
MPCSNIANIAAMHLSQCADTGRDDGSPSHVTNTLDRLSGNASGHGTSWDRLHYRRSARNDSVVGIDLLAMPRLSQESGPLRPLGRAPSASPVLDVLDIERRRRWRRLRHSYSRNGYRARQSEPLCRSLPIPRISAACAQPASAHPSSSQR